MSVDMQSEVQQHELRKQQMQEELQKQKAAYSQLTSDEKIDKLLDMNTITQININQLSSQIGTFCQAMNLRLGNIEENVDKIDAAQKSMAQDVKKTDEEVGRLKAEISELKDFVQKTKVETINRDVHGRRYNLIFGNVRDAGAWEAVDKTEFLVRELLHKINTPVDDNDVDEWDPDTVVIKEAHRLPQNPVKFKFTKKDGDSAQERTKCRLIVAKFELMTDVNIILKKCRNLQKVNNGKATYKRYYIDRHLPKCLQVQKNDLKSEFKQMKQDGKKTRFRYNFDTAQMYLIDAKKDKSTN